MFSQNEKFTGMPENEALLMQVLSSQDSNSKLPGTWMDKNRRKLSIVQLRYLKEEEEGHQRR